MSNTVTRAMLSEAATYRTGLNKVDVATIADAMFALLGDALMNGGNVKLTGFGSLQVRARAERIGRNPRTGTEHRITPRHTVIFTPSAHLREALIPAGKSQPAISVRAREKNLL